jgi:pyruvate kinase
MFRNVKYFAVSNAESAASIAAIRQRLPKRIGLIPKIESARGVRNFREIIKNAAAQYAMLDKEDLYLDVSRRMGTFESLVEEARLQAKECAIYLLELQGVVFA